MMPRRTSIPLTVLVLLTLMFTPLNAMAQSAADTTPVPRYHTLDVGVSGGMLFTNGHDFEGSRTGFFSPQSAASLDAGWYWTQHLKAEVGLMVMSSRVFVEDTTPASRNAPRKFDIVHPAGLSVGAAYQFFENEFVHPYVAAGITSTWFPTVTVRSPAPLVRPFAAGGFKSYFNERTFTRSELLFAVGPHGYSHATLRVGVGMDF